MYHWRIDNTDWLLAVSILTALTSIPLALGWVPPNPFYGFKTRFTRSSPAVWYPANAFVGRGMLAASLFSAVILYMKPFALRDAWIEALVVVLPIMLVLAAGFAYLRHLRETLERR